MKNDNSVLVTGGAGFIGSHLVQALVEKAYRVTVLDSLVTGRLSNLAGVTDAVTFIEGDIQDKHAIDQAVKGCQVVFHLAAMVSVAQTIEQPLESFAVNDVGTLNVLEAARQNDVQCVVLASSSAVYGNDPLLPKSETMPLRPLSPYAVQKLTNEYYAELYHRLYGLKTVCLRYFNVYGPRQDSSLPYSGVISLFMARAARGEGPLIYGDGQQTRDFVFVKDVVSANLLAARSENVSGQVVNIGTGQPISINMLWEKIARLANCQATPEYADHRPGDILKSCSDIRKAHDQMGFKPVTDLKEGLRQTLMWYQ